MRIITEPERLAERIANRKVEEIMKHKPRYNHYAVSGKSLMKIIKIDFKDFNRKDELGGQLVSVGYIKDRKVCNIYENIFHENEGEKIVGKKYHINFLGIAAESRKMRTDFRGQHENKHFHYNKPFTKLYYKELNLDIVKEEAEKVMEHTVLDMFFVEKGKERKILLERGKNLY